MELVDGVGIGLHAERERLGTDGRLELLAQVADAVHHAHERGVIHRDLKPDNVLVDGRGRPVVLDFGVARARESSDVLTTMRTEEGALLGTLAYMAPEQLSGGPETVTPRIDVYALGVLAFELLSGRLPYEVAGLSLPVAIKALNGDLPKRLGDLVPTLRGDVETIVSTALAREPERRYPSAEAFAADIRRHLDHRPIAARPTSRIYRARKYARRHRSMVAGACVLGVAALVSGFFALRAAREAKAAQDASAHLRSVVEELAQPFPVATRFLRDAPAGLETLMPGELLAEGDRVTLEVRSLQELNLYVFNQDDSGVMSQIFPIEDLQPQNPLLPNVNHRLPGTFESEQVSWTIASAGGIERFLLLALPSDVRFDRARWNLEREIQATESVYDAPRDLRSVGTDPASEAAPALALGTHPLSAFDVLRARMKEFGQGWVRVVQFESGPGPEPPQ